LFNRGPGIVCKFLFSGKQWEILRHYIMCQALHVRNICVLAVLVISLCFLYVSHLEMLRNNVMLSGKVSKNFLNCFPGTFIMLIFCELHWVLLRGDIFCQIVNERMNILNIFLIISVCFFVRGALKICTNQYNI